jgi:hypothetical protein
MIGRGFDKFEDPTLSLATMIDPCKKYIGFAMSGKGEEVEARKIKIETPSLETPSLETPSEPETTSSVSDDDDGAWFKMKK